VSSAQDRWSSGNDYEAFMGRWSRLVAAEFVPGLAVPAGARWLDVGCGTGELTAEILRSGSPSRVVGVDPSEAFIEHARAHVLDDRVRFAVGTADSLPSDEGPYDAVVLGLALNFIPDRGPALAALRSALEAGGILAAYVWDYAGEMWFLRHFWDAAHDLDASVDEGARFAFCNPDDLRDMFIAAGLDAVETYAIVVPTRFASFDDYWNPFLAGTGPAPAFLATLAPKQVDAVRESVRARLPIAADGSIDLTARAWVVRGRAG
jgi:SAM-dependent methyltransferase